MLLPGCRRTLQEAADSLGRLQQADPEHEEVQQLQARLVQLRRQGRLQDGRLFARMLGAAAGDIGRKS
jgi:hypothetical protein